jgi:Tfp pilus assembly protein PilE
LFVPKRFKKFDYKKEGSEMIGEKLKRENGMTVVELVLTLFILGIVMIPLSYLLNTSYIIYYEENDKMSCLTEVNDAMQMIIDDIRKNDEYRSTQSTIIVSPSALTITTTPAITFEYDVPTKKILRSGVSIFSGNNQTEILAFSVNEKKPAGYDTGVIDITITAKCGKSENITLTNSYRRKK